MLFNPFNGHYLLELQFQTIQKDLYFCPSISALVSQSVCDDAGEKNKESLLVSTIAVQIKTRSYWEIWFLGHQLEAIWIRAHIRLLYARDNSTH